MKNSIAILDALNVLVHVKLVIWTSVKIVVPGMLTIVPALPYLTREAYNVPVIFAFPFTCNEPSTTEGGYD